eukprot:8436712-Prorocentrum_lima.AAC.1
MRALQVSASPNPIAAATSSLPSTWEPTTLGELTTHPCSDAARALRASAFQISVLSLFSSTPPTPRRRSA